jgi:hypothetical protein
MRIIVRSMPRREIVFNGSVALERLVEADEVEIISCLINPSWQSQLAAYVAQQQDKSFTIIRNQFERIILSLANQLHQKRIRNRTPIIYFDDLEREARHELQLGVDGSIAYLSRRIFNDELSMETPVAVNMQTIAIQHFASNFLANIQVMNDEAFVNFVVSNVVEGSLEAES